jgi:hypothetical protein
MAVVQLRNPTEGRAYYGARKAGGMPSMMAMRALKRRLSNVVYAKMLADQSRREHQQATGPGGQRGNDSDSSATGSHPHTGTSDKPLPGSATTQRGPYARPCLDIKGCHERDVRHLGDGVQQTVQDEAAVVVVRGIGMGMSSLEADRMRALAAEAEPHLVTEPVEWNRKVAVDHDRLTGALQSFIAGGDVTAAVVANLRRYWFDECHHAEARDLSAAAVELDGASSAPRY